MKQYKIYFHGYILVGHAVAKNAEAAISKFREHNSYLANNKLVAEEVVESSLEQLEITAHLV